MRLVLVAMAALLIVAAPAHAQSFAPLPGEGGCIIQTGLDLEDFDEDEVPQGCGRAGGLLGADSATVSPDGRFVYVVSGGGATSGSNGIAWFAREASGALAARGCVTATGGDGRVGSDGLCGRADALRGAAQLAFSADGKFAYVVSSGSNAVTWFSRDADTGALTQRGCLKQFLTFGETCAAGYSLDGASGVAVSADGKHVYVASSRSNSVVTFARNDVTGALTELGCVSDTGSDGQCADGTALAGAQSVLAASDGADVYVTSALSGSVTAFRRDAATGRLTPSGCLLAEAPSGGPCTSVPSLTGAAGGAITADGKSLYIAGPEPGTITTLARDAATGTLAAAGCLQDVPPAEAELIDPDDYYGFEDGEDLIAGCVRASSLGTARAVSVAADGRSVYVAADYRLTAFTRDPAGGALTQFGCAESGAYLKACSVARGLSGASAIAASGDGRNLYVANGGLSSVTVFSASVAIASSAARVSRAGTIRVRLACPRAARSCAGDVRVAGARAARFRLAVGARRTFTVRVSRGAARRHTAVVVARTGAGEVRRRVALR